MCVGKGCKYSFVDRKSKCNDDGKNNEGKTIIDYVPSAKKYVMTCMEVNTCDYALCLKCYTKLLLGDESNTGLGGVALGSHRRSSRKRSD